MEWEDKYKEHIAKRGGMEKYVQYKAKSKHVFIDLVEKYCNKDKSSKVLEAGCGSGAFSTFLAGLGYSVIGIDIDPKILKLAEEMSLTCNKANKPSFIMKSILSLDDFRVDEFNVIFSNGVLEHFLNREIIKTLSEQMRISKYVIFGIPTKYFDVSELEYGNERLLEFSYWRDLIKKSGGMILEEKKCHFKPPLEIICDIKKYFRPYPYKIFVIKKTQKN